MMTIETVAGRRRAGIALGAGLLAFWLSQFPWGALGLVLRLGGFVALGLCLRWAIDGDHPVRRKIAGITLVVAFALQVRNFFQSASFTEDSPYNAFVQFYLADHLLPAVLLLSVALFPRAGRRRTETALLWTAVGLSSLLVVVGLANGMMMQTRGDPTPTEYRAIVALMRTVSYGPAFAAAIMLLVPARQVVTEEQAWALVRKAQAEAAAALQEAAAAMTELPSEPEASAEPVVTSAVPSVPGRASAEHDVLTLLEGRLARGEISEATYLMLRAKYETLGPAKLGQRHPD
jgi:uncharacterized membrane protein